MQLGRVVSFVPCTKKKKLSNVITSFIFLRPRFLSTAILTLARCFPRFKRDPSSFFFVPFEKYKVVQAYRTKNDRDHRESMKFFVLSLIFLSFKEEKKKKRKNRFKIRRTKGNNFSTMEIPQIGMFRKRQNPFSGFCFFVLSTMNRRDLAINGNREFL